MTKTGEAATPRLDLTDEETLLEALERNRRPLTIIAIVVAVGLGGFWMMRRSAEIRETRALTALSVGENAFANGNTTQALVEYDRVLNRYAGTSAGTQAGLLAAQLKFEAGQVDSAMARLDLALAKAPSHLKAAVLAHQAAGHALSNRPAESAAAYEQASAAARFKQEKEGFRMDAARQYALAGNVEAARAIYRDLADREDSAYSGEARLRLGELLLKS